MTLKRTFKQEPQSISLCPRQAPSRTQVSVSSTKSGDRNSTVVKRDENDSTGPPALPSSNDALRGTKRNNIHLDAPASCLPPAKKVNSSIKEIDVPDASTSSGNAVASSSKRVAGSTSPTNRKSASVGGKQSKAAVKKEIDTEMPDASAPIVTICADRKPVSSTHSALGRIPKYPSTKKEPIANSIGQYKTPSIKGEIDESTVDAFLSTVKVDLSTYPTQRNPTASSSIMKVKKEQDMTPTIKKEIDEPMIDAPSSKVDSARQERKPVLGRIPKVSSVKDEHCTSSDVVKRDKSPVVKKETEMATLQASSSKKVVASVTPTKPTSSAPLPPRVKEPTSSGVGPTTAAKNVMNALDAPPSSSKVYSARQERKFILGRIPKVSGVKDEICTSTNVLGLDKRPIVKKETETVSVQASLSSGKVVEPVTSTIHAKPTPAPSLPVTKATASLRTGVTTAAKNVMDLMPPPSLKVNSTIQERNPMLARIPKIPKIQNVVLNSQVENRITPAMKKGVGSVDVSVKEEAGSVNPRNGQDAKCTTSLHTPVPACNVEGVDGAPPKGSNTQGVLGNTTMRSSSAVLQPKTQSTTLLPQFQIQAKPTPDIPPAIQGLDHHTLFEYIHKISRSVWKQHFHKAHFWVLIGDDKGSNKDTFMLAKSEFVVDVLMSVLDDEEEVEEVDFVAIPATMSVPRNLSYKVPHPILVTGASARLTKELVERRYIDTEWGWLAVFPAHLPVTRFIMYLRVPLRDSLENREELQTVIRDKLRSIKEFHQFVDQHSTNPRLLKLPKERRVEGILSSIRAVPLDEMIENGLLVIMWRIYMHPISASAEFHWSVLVKELRDMRFVGSTWIAEPVRAGAYRCDKCKGLDHPTDMCPVGEYPGYWRRAITESGRKL